MNWSSGQAEVDLKIKHAQFWLTLDYIYLLALFILFP